jgi:hypothetical protein
MSQKSKKKKGGGFNYSCQIGDRSEGGGSQTLEKVMANINSSPVCQDAIAKGGQVKINLD